jgi:hypothetical protein
MRPATIFKLIKPTCTFCLSLEAQIFVPCISQQGELIKGGFCKHYTGKFDFSHMTSTTALTGCMYLEILSITVVEHATIGLHSEHGPILMNTERVLYRNAR